MLVSGIVVCQGRLTMLRHGQTCVVARLHEDNVASVLSILQPTSSLEGTNGPLPRNRGKRCHYTPTSISCTAIVNGMLLALRASKQPAIASRIFSSASDSVAP